VKNYTVNYWLAGGLAPSKLILGIPLYGQSFTLASATANGLNDKEPVFQFSRRLLCSTNRMQLIFYVLFSCSQ
jgi:GH18 family chitinase